MFTGARKPLALLGISVLVVLLVLSALPPATARAQCGQITSACYTCHAETDPVNGATPWHSTWGHWYACWNCHGGNDTTRDQTSAHVGVARNPLEDAHTSCYACHPQDCQRRAAQYATLLDFRDPITCFPRAPSSLWLTTLPSAAMPIH